MKKSVKITISYVSFIFITLVFLSCGEQSNAAKEELALNTKASETLMTGPEKPLSEAFKKYWYAGTAEITSYSLEQARYGELRDGTAVLVYVTEPFLGDKQVKADADNPNNIPVLKLNSTKNYLTGIYPYSIMSSTFYPVYDNQHALKVSGSVQEWCGHVYAQLNNREQFEFMSHSYFEGEADQQYTIEKTHLENELWNKIRIRPKELPIGAISLIPSLEYIRLGHKELKAYNATASLSENGELSTYEVHYPELERTLVITFDTAFPHAIESWTETFKSGFGPNAKLLTSKAKKLKSLKTAYWQKNKNKDVFLRDSLGL